MGSLSYPYHKKYLNLRLFQQFWEKDPGQNREKMIDFKAKLGEINDIEHNKGSKSHFRLYNANHTT